MSTTTIRVDAKTKTSLEALKHPGQSYDGLLREMAAEVKMLRGLKPTATSAFVLSRTRAGG